MPRRGHLRAFLLLPLLALAAPESRADSPAATPESLVPGPESEVDGGALAFAYLGPKPLHLAQPEFTKEQLPLVKRAIQLARAGQGDNARALAGGLGNPLFSDLVDWLLAQAPLRGKRDRDDFSRFSALLEEHPDWPRRWQLELAAERSLPESLPAAEVVAWFGAREPASATGLIRLADAMTASGRPDSARRLVQRLWVERDYETADQREILAKGGAWLGRADHLARFERLIAERRLSDARMLAPKLPQAQQTLAEALMALAYDRPGVDGLLNRLPAHLLNDPALLLERARWRQRRERWDGVVELIDAKAEGPRPPGLWWNLRAWAARGALERHDPVGAYELVKAHGAEDGAVFAEGEWMAGFLALSELKTPRLALEHFIRLYEGVSTPVSLARGAFWAGEATAATGDAETAQSWYETAAGFPTTFYGQQALTRLGRPLAIEVSAEVPQAPRKPPLPGEAELVRAAKILTQFDQRRQAEAFIAALRGRAENPDDTRRIGSIAHSLGRPDQALRLARSQRADGDLALDELFPMRALPVVDAEIDESLVLAVIRQESGFDRAARSPAGARGLMQIMPGTAKNVARRHRLRYNDRWLTDEPLYNLALGSRFLADLLRRYDGEAALAIAAYNAGPGRVTAWLRRNGDPRHGKGDALTRWLFWIERIPFDETRNYVQRVLEGRAVYEAKRRGQVHRADVSTATLPSSEN